MKKLLLLIIIAGLLGGGGYFLYQQLGGESSDVEGVLPPKAIVYMRVNNVQDAMAQLNQTPLWQALSKVNYDLLLETAEQPEVGVFINMVKEWANDTQTQTIYDKFFSKEVALAFYSPKGNLANLDINALNNPGQILDAVFPTLYLVTRVDSDVQFAELVARTTKSFGSDIQKSSVAYKDFSIQLLTETKAQLTFAYVRINDLLIVALNEESIRNSIDAYLGENKSLKEDPSLVKAFKNQEADTDIWTYLDFGNLFGIFEQLMVKAMEADPDTTDQSMKGMEQAMQDMKAFSSFGTSIVLGNMMKVFSTMEYDASMLSGSTAAIYKNCRSMVNRSIKFVPKETIAYQWSGCLDLKVYWDQMMEGLAEAAGGEVNVTQQIAGVEAMIGMSVEKDLIPAIGDEWGIYLENIEQLSGFPLPALALFVEVKDQEKISSIMSQLMQNPMMQLQEEQYGSTKVNYMVSPFPAVQPGYSFIDGYFVLAINKKLLHKSIDAITDKSKSLTAKPSFKDIDLGLTKKSVNVFFADVSQLIADLENVIDWSKQFMAQKDSQQEAFKEGAKAKLEDTLASLNQAKIEIEETKGAILTAEDEVWDLENQSLDSTAKKQEIEDLRAAQSALEQDVLDLQEQIKEFEGVVAGYDENYVTPEERDVYLNEFFLPLFQSFKSIESMGGFTTMSNDIIDSGLFIKM